MSVTGCVIQYYAIAGKRTHNPGLWIHVFYFFFQNGNKNAKANKMKWPASESRTGTDSSKVDEADDEEEFEVFTRSRLRKLRDHHLYHQKENRVETSSASVNYANVRMLAIKLFS